MSNETKQEHPREEYIQPKDQPREIILSYGMLASAHNFIMGVLA